MSASCRACDAGQLDEVLDFGRMPLAGNFLPLGHSNNLYPLAVDVCRRCGLLQVRDQVPHSLVFTSSYSYASSTVPSLVRHFEEYARERALSGGDAPKRLLEIGCNDGVFLKPLAEAGYSVVGIDACENIAEMALTKGLDVMHGVFDLERARRLKDKYGNFNVVTCSNVFAHIPDLRGFVEGVNLLLDERDGEFWVEVHSANSLYSGLQWDCFYHEHCFYWSIHSLTRFLRGMGLQLQRYRLTPMHGGALRAVFSKSRTSGTRIREREVTPRDWGEFGRKCHRSRVAIRDSIEALDPRYAYGAAGRAVILINWTGIAPNLEFVVDGSPLRYGRAIPNTSVPIISEEAFAKRSDVDGWCFVTAHNNLDSIREKVDSFFPDRQTKYVTPLPQVRIQ